MEKATGLTSKRLNTLYPDVYSTCYSLPSVKFNTWKLKALADNSEVYATDVVYDSDRRGAEAEQRVLSSFQSLFEHTENKSICPMFLLCNVRFEDVLKMETTPPPPDPPVPRSPGKPRRRKRRSCAHDANSNQPEGQQVDGGETPSTPSTPLPSRTRRGRLKGDADVIIMQKRVGLVILEVKATGDRYSEGKDPHKVLVQVLKDTVKACTPTTSGSASPAAAGAATASETPTHECDKKHFVADLCSKIGLSLNPAYILAFPNVSRADLQKAAADCPEFLEVSSYKQLNHLVLVLPLFLSFFSFLFSMWASD
jgi:hypothetical protein